MKVLTIILGLFIILNNSISAQNKNLCKIGLNYTDIGKSSINYSEQIDGALGYKGDHFYLAGLNFIYAPCTCSDIETGIEYAHHSIIVYPNPPSETGSASYTGSIDIISIPANIRLNLFKYFFINGGILLDIDVSKSSPIDNQTGIGVNYGAGLKCDFKFGLTVYTNAFARTHSWISFIHAENSQKLVDAGVKFGITYQLK
jgi:hypothetical protein